MSNKRARAAMRFRGQSARVRPRRQEIRRNTFNHGVVGSNPAGLSPAGFRCGGGGGGDLKGTLPSSS